MCLPIPHNECRVFLAKHLIIQVRQPPAQPRFSSLQLLGFPRAKIAIERAEIEENVTWQLMVILKEYLEDCFEKWKGHWGKCVIFQGEYFEGD
jgi:hypothetical protein